MTRLAAIDIGTNSMRLLLCSMMDGKLLNKEKHMKVTRIGQDVSETGKISEAAMARNIDALKLYKELAELYGAESIVAIATSAVRDANNKEAFLSEALKETGINIKVISGDEEAELGILGVISEFPEEEDFLVIDIGGGSTELILYGKNKIEFSKSINAGSVRMTEGYISRRPVAEEDAASLNIRLKEVFGESVSILKTKKIKKAIAIGGTAVTLAAIHKKADTYRTYEMHNTIVSYLFLDEILKKLSSMMLEELYNVKGLHKDRADVITAGLSILKHLTDQLSIEDIYISDSDNLEGAIKKYI